MLWRDRRKLRAEMQVPVGKKTYGVIPLMKDKKRLTFMTSPKGKKKSSLKPILVLVLLHRFISWYVGKLGRETFARLMEFRASDSPWETGKNRRKISFSDASASPHPKQEFTYKFSPFFWPKNAGIIEKNFWHGGIEMHGVW